MEKRKKLTDEQVEQVAVRALSNSLGAPDTDVGQARLRNLEAYNAQPVGEYAPPEIADRSDFVATDVADTVNGMLPNLMQMFVASDDAVEFEGRGLPGSEQEGKLATAYINHVFYVQNDGVSVIHDWFWDALVMKVGFVKVWAEDEQEDSKQAYEGLAPEQLVMLQRAGWTLVDDPEQDPQTGLLSFVVEKNGERKAIKCGAVAPAQMRIDANARWDDEPAMIGEVFYKRRFEWTQDGYDVSEVGGGGGDRSDLESQELLGESSDGSSQVAHDSHEQIKGAEIYIKLDADGDGIAEWLKVCLVEDKLAKLTGGKPAYEQVDDHPYVWTCPNPRPHSFFGDCPADFAISAQRLRTTTVRAIEDNLFASVNQRTYVNMSANVNIDDVLDSRPNGIIRGKGPANEAIQSIATTNLGQPAYQFQEFIASWNETRTGYNRYSAGTDANALNKTKGGMELMTAKADMRMGLTARHFAVGVRKLFAKLLKLAIQHQNVPEMVALNGTFVPINPSEFKDQLRVKINVGLGTGTKEQQASRILALMQAQGMGAQFGVVGPEHVAESIRLYVEALEYKNPERFVSPQPTGMPPNPEAFKAMQAQVQQQMGQAQQQMQEMGKEIQRLEQENFAVKADAQLAKIAAAQKSLAADAKGTPETPEDDSVEWAKIDIQRFDSITKRMALGYEVNEADRQFALNHFQTLHGASMAEAAHAQRDAQLQPTQD